MAYVVVVVVVVVNTIEVRSFQIAFDRNASGFIKFDDFWLILILLK